VDSEVHAGLVCEGTEESTDGSPKGRDDDDGILKVHMLLDWFRMEM
jgi:hypothetical protein